MARNNVPSIRRKLLTWYGKNKRELPWRRTDDPYAIWIAETMLQQTQVTTVLHYYSRFLSNFPSVQSLARARLHKVLTLWSGLGYYKRAENLRKAARQIVRHYNGKIPANYDGLRALPGVGNYTAGAVMSIAFHKPYPAVDGNARRVLGRLLRITNEPSLQCAARQLVPISKPGYFNQGLMELGATICTPRQPRCSQCPVASNCATQSGVADKNPAQQKRQNFKDIKWPLAIIRSHGKILLRRRSAQGQLAKMWELPGGEKPPNKSSQAILRDQLNELGGCTGFLRPIGEIRHSITNRRITAPVFLLDLETHNSIFVPGTHWHWVRPAALFRYPVVAMTRKAVSLLAHEENFL